MDPVRVREEVRREWKREGNNCPLFSRHSINHSTQLLAPLELVCPTFLTALSFQDSTPLTELPCHRPLLGAALTLGLLLLLPVLEPIRLQCTRGKELFESLLPGLGSIFRLYWEGSHPTLALLFLLPLSREPSMLRILRRVCSVLLLQEAKDPLDNKLVLQDLRACHLALLECLQDLPFSLLGIKVAHLQDSELYNCSKFSLSWGLQFDLKARGRKT